MKHDAPTGIALALTAALLFGGVNAAGRIAILGGMQPLWVAGLAYLSGGLLLLPIALKARVARADWPRFALMVGFGAIAAPLLLYNGLARTSVVDASLLLTLEMPFTAALAAVLLRERAYGRELVGLLCLGVAAVFVALGAGQGGASAPLGLLMVGLAALSWSIDNTASTPLASRYAAQDLIAWKTLIGGSVVLAAAFLIERGPGGSWAEWSIAVASGVFGVAVSSIIFYLALARIGATRTTVLFSVSALVGASIGYFLLDEPLTIWHGVAAVLAATGIGLVTTSKPAN